MNKKLIIFPTLFVFASLSAMAQTAPTFSSKGVILPAQTYTSARQYNQLSPTPVDEEHRAIGEKLHPRLGGVFVDGAKYGAQLINPYAPAKFGNGEKYATAPSGSITSHPADAPSGLRDDRRITNDHRDSGGIKLFSFEF